MPSMMLLDELRRPASLAQIGGFRPPEDPLASWAGRVRVAAEGEEWPSPSPPVPATPKARKGERLT